MCGEDKALGPLPAGTYYVKVLAGAFYDTTATDYTLLVWFE